MMTVTKLNNEKQALPTHLSTLILIIGSSPVSLLPHRLSSRVLRLAGTLPLRLADVVVTAAEGMGVGWGRRGGGGRKSR